jgi:hypothetical protein
MTEPEEFLLARPMPAALRSLLGAAGIFVIVAPVWDFWRAFVPPNWASLFYGALILGAWSVGGTFLVASVLGEDQRWRLRVGAIEILRRTALWRRTTVIRAKDVIATTVEERTGTVAPTHSASSYDYGTEKRSRRMASRNAKTRRRSKRACVAILGWIRSGAWQAGDNEDSFASPRSTLTREAPCRVRSCNRPAEPGRTNP